MRSVLTNNKKSNVSLENDSIYEGGSNKKRELNISSNTNKTGDTEIFESPNRIQSLSPSYL